MDLTREGDLPPSLSYEESDWASTLHRKGGVRGTLLLSVVRATLLLGGGTSGGRATLLLGLGSGGRRAEWLLGGGTGGQWRI